VISMSHSPQVCWQDHKEVENYWSSYFFHLPTWKLRPRQ
jgi:hypothetical protein